MKRGIPKSSPRCIRKLFSVIEQACKKEEAVVVSRLTTLLSILLSADNYADVNKVTISLLAGLHDYFKFIRKTHYLYKIYTSYLDIILELLEVRTRFDTSLPEKFSPVLFSILMQTNNTFSSELRIEASKSLNSLLDDEGSKLHRYLLKQSVVKEHWLDIGKEVEKAGDYELQVTLMELLCRLFSPKDRQKHLTTLFAEESLQKILTEFCDEEFEKDCRRFLNTMNEGLKLRMVYSFYCSRVSLGTFDLDLPPQQHWLDMNFGSNTLTMFIIDKSANSVQYDTLIINPANVAGHEYTVDNKHFHLVLKLNVPIGNLLDCKKDCMSRTVHFVLDATPSPKGPLLGLLGPHLTGSPAPGSKQSFRVDVSAESIQICGDQTTIVQTPTMDRAMRLSQTRQLLTKNMEQNIPKQSEREPSLSQLDLSSSQPERKQLRAFTACEPIIANPQAPKPSPARSFTVIQDTLNTDMLFSGATSDEALLIPDSLPVSVIPDSQRTEHSADKDENWKLQSSFDPTIPLNDSELSIVWEDSIRDLAIKEERMPEQVEGFVKQETGLIKKPINMVPPFKTNNMEAGATMAIDDEIKQVNKEDTNDAINSKKQTQKIKPKQETKSKKKLTKKSLDIVNTSSKNPPIITIGGSKEHATELPLNQIKIKNNVEKKDELEITTVVAVEYENIESDNSPITGNLETDPDSPVAIIQDEFDNIPSSPGDIYKNILHIKNDKKAASPANRSFKRKLMDTEEHFLFSQVSPLNSQTSSQIKKIPAFARKRKSLNTSSSFVLSKAKPAQHLESRAKKEIIPDDILPVAPLRKSILKRKFLNKSSPENPTTPKLGSFDFDEKSPASEASWVKKHGQKKRTAGFKTKQQKYKEEKEAKRLLKKQTKKKETPPKKYSKKRKVEEEVSDVSEEEQQPEERITTKLVPRRRVASSPSPPPTQRSTRYAMRSRTKSKKIIYKDHESDEETVSVSASEFSTTTQSTSHNVPKTKPFQLSQSSQDEPSPTEILQDLDTSLNKILANEPITVLQEEKCAATLFNEAMAETRQETANTQSVSYNQIQALSKKYDTKNSQQNSQSSDSDVHDDHMSSPEIDRIPSTETVGGIPLTMTSDMPSFNSILSKDPSPIIKTNRFKLPTDQIKSITMNLQPQIKTISPLMDTEEDMDLGDGVEIFEETGLEAEEIPRLPNESGFDGEQTSNRPKTMYTQKEKRDKFKVNELSKKEKKVITDIFGAELRSKQSKKKYAKKKKTVPKNSSFATTSKSLDQLQKSFDLINSSVVLEVDKVRATSDVQRMVIQEEKSNNKEQKPWLGSQSGNSSSGSATKTDYVEPAEAITTMAINDVTNSQIAIKFSEISNCMITEADSPGLSMEIDQYDSLETVESKQCDMENMFASILEESRLAAEQDKAADLGTLISTPTKLSHIKAAQEANESPFATYLKKIGSTTSPIKRKIPECKTAPSKSTVSRLQDSGLGTSTIHTSFSITNVTLPALTETSPQQHLHNSSPIIDRPKTPSQTPGSQNKKDVSSQKELQDYYEMLCKTPGNECHGLPSSQQPTSQSSVWSAAHLPLPELQLPALQHIVDVTSSPNTQPGGGSASDAGSDMSSMSAMLPALLEGQDGMALQLFHNQAKKLKEKRKLTSKENVAVVYNDINKLSTKFFFNNRAKRTSALEEFTNELENDIETMKTEVLHAKKKEDEALKSLARCHKTQTESRISLQNKMSLLKERNCRMNRDLCGDLMLGNAQELRQSLQKQLHLRQKLLDKSQVQCQRKQLMKQMALIMMDMDS